MKKSTLIVLSAVAAIVLIAALYTSSQRGALNMSGSTQDVFYPEFKEKIDTVDKVTLTSPTRKLSFDRKAEKWVASYKYNYPANARLIQKTLHTLATMKKTDAKTKKPEFYSKLGVEAELTSGSRGFIIEAFANEEPLLHTHIGARASTGKDEFYARDHAQEQVFQVRGDLSLKDDDETWLSANIINLDRKRIMAVNFIDSTNKKYTISRENAKETSFTLSPLPKGRKIKSPYVIDVAGKALTNMQLNDVQPLANFKMAGTPFATYRLFDGLVVQLFYADKPEKAASTLGVQKKGWIHLKTSLDEAQFAKSKADKAELVAEIERLNARHKEWAYHIPAYKIEQMKRTYDSLLDPVEEKKSKKAKK